MAPTGPVGFSFFHPLTDSCVSIDHALHGLEWVWAPGRPCLIKKTVFFPCNISDLAPSLYKQEVAGEAGIYRGRRFQWLVSCVLERPRRVRLCMNGEEGKIME